MKRFSLFLTAAVFLSLGITMNLMAADDVDASHNVSITVKEVALIGLSNTEAIAFTIDVKDGDEGTPGDEIVVTKPDEADLTKYLQYTTILGSTSFKTISVSLKAITDEAFPKGAKLTVTPTEFVAAGGDTGEVFGDTIDLTDLEFTGDTSAGSTFISTIFTGWTGTGETDGCKLIYDLTLPKGDDYEIKDLRAKEYEVEVIYTLKDAFAG